MYICFFTRPPEIQHGNWKSPNSPWSLSGKVMVDPQSQCYVWKHFDGEHFGVNVMDSWEPYCQTDFFSVVRIYDGLISMIGCFLAISPSTCAFEPKLRLNPCHVLVFPDWYKCIGVAMLIVCHWFHLKEFHVFDIFWTFICLIPWTLYRSISWLFQVWVHFPTSSWDDASNWLIWLHYYPLVI